MRKNSTVSAIKTNWLIGPLQVLGVVLLVDFIVLIKATSKVIYVVLPPFPLIVCVWQTSKATKYSTNFVNCCTENICHKT